MDLFPYQMHALEFNAITTRALFTRADENRETVKVYV